jgi:DNA processing protein
MKKLILKPNLKKKLDRLPDKVDELSFLGADPNELAKHPIVAVVGTRKPTPYGKRITEQITSELARAGVVIVSGLAYGVDIIAAKATITENGSTIAILPSGLENIYPASHAKIAKKIKENGCLISEFPPKHKPIRHEFLQRNRIIAAMSNLVIIPEAAARSGSLNTAKHAIEMGIPVCVVPGPVTSSMSEGTNNLVKEGKAKLITSAQDVLEMLGVNTKAKDVLGNNDAENAILDIIKQGISETQLIQQETELSTDKFQTSLTMLEIDGKIHQDELGNWYIK